MPVCTDVSPLRIAVSFGACTPRLSALLALQRAEEPQTPIRLHEVELGEQLHGLAYGRYHGGLALTDAPTSALRAEVLWHDQLALAMPAYSPLRAYNSVPLEVAVRHPIIRWQTPACEPISTLVDSLVQRQQTIGFRVQSYELMAVLIRAGYGFGIGLQSHIVRLCAPHIVSRPLSGCPQALTTYLLQPGGDAAPALDRLARRGREQF
ncbi:hypothetical protein GG851_18880 [Bordetella petrii]|nr:hypothetical protein [Bordetella petrii]